MLRGASERRLSAVRLDGVRIVVLTTWYPSARNPGAGSFIARDAAALARDHEVRVVHLAAPELDDGARDFEHLGVPVRRVPLDARTPRGWVRAQRLRAEILDGADLVHTMAAPSLLPFLAQRPRIGWVHTEHWSGVVNLAGDGRSRWLRPLSRRAFSGPDEVVAVSEYLAGAVRALRSGQVRVIGNIVDAVAVPSSDRTPGPDGLRLLGVGAVKATKGWRLAIDALRQLRDAGVDASLTWLGDGPETPELQAAARGLPVRAPGHASPADVRAAMADSDVMLLPTTGETFSLVTVEALSAGLPVVATGVGAHAEFLTPGAGVIVDRTPQALAAGALSMRGADRESIARHGRELLDRFSETAFRRAYLDVYRRVLEL